MKEEKEKEVEEKDSDPITDYYSLKNSIYTPSYEDNAATLVNNLLPDSTLEENKNEDKTEEEKLGEDKGDTGNNTSEDTGEDMDDDDSDSDYTY